MTSISGESWGLSQSSNRRLDRSFASSSDQQTREGGASPFLTYSESISLLLAGNTNGPLSTQSSQEGSLTTVRTLQLGLEISECPKSASLYLGDEIFLSLPLGRSFFSSSSSSLFLLQVEGDCCKDF